MGQHDNCHTSLTGKCGGYNKGFVEAILRFCGRYTMSIPMRVEVELGCGKIYSKAMHRLLGSNSSYGFCFVSNCVYVKIIKRKLVDLSCHNYVVLFEVWHLFRMF